MPLPLGSGFSQKERRKSKLLKRSAYADVPIIITVVAVTFFSSQTPSTENSNLEIPRAPIHWHPTL